MTCVKINSKPSRFISTIINWLELCSRSTYEVLSESDVYVLFVCTRTFKTTLQSIAVSGTYTLMHLPPNAPKAHVTITQSVWKHISLRNPPTGYINVLWFPVCGMHLLFNMSFIVRVSFTYISEFCQPFVRQDQEWYIQIVYILYITNRSWNVWNLNTLKQQNICVCADFENVRPAIPKYRINYHFIKMFNVCKRLTICDVS